MQKVYTEDDIRMMLNKMICEIDSLSVNWEYREFYDVYKVGKDSAISIIEKYRKRWCE